MTALLDATRVSLERIVREAQREARCPSLSAGLVRGGELVWSSHVGWADVDARTAPDDTTPYLIGSVTKTFTALLLVQLRDAGLLDLDDPLDRHLDDAPRGLTLRAMLAHASGLQREYATPAWETLQFPDAQELLADLSRVERVLAPHLEYHYSNLAYALLAQVVERVGGAPWEEQLRERIAGPLGLGVTLTPDERTRARGYYVDPYTAQARPEPVASLAATAPVGGLWASVADLARYAAFLADPCPEVVDPASVEEMCRPLIVTDLLGWTRAYGLGFSLHREGERVLAGHDGAMPGFLAGVRVHRASGVGAVVLTNGSTGADTALVARRLATTVLDAEPVLPEPWVPGEVDPRLAELTGTWWTEGNEIRFVVEDGALVCGQPGRGWAATRSRFEPAGPDRFRVAGGRERGERLEVVRGADGGVERMRMAGYAVTREPLTFDEL